MPKIPGDIFYPGRGAGLRGSHYVTTNRTGTFVSKWPKPRGPAKSPAQQRAQDDFAAACVIIKNIDPLMQAVARDVSRYTPLLPRDFLMMQLFQRAFHFVLPDGSKVYSMAAMQDVSALLDAIWQEKNGLLLRDDSLWKGLPPGTPTQVLSVDLDGNVVWQDPTVPDSGSRWHILRDWTFAASGPTVSVEADLTGYHDMQIVLQNVASSVSGWRAAQVSADGGSTWKTTAQYANIASAGSITNDNAFFLYAGATTAGRYGTLIVSEITQTGAPISSIAPARGFPQFMQSTRAPINRVRVCNFDGAGAIAGNMTSGEIWILAR